jgi:uncharacterized membrane protein (UPF0127 family)
MFFFLFLLSSLFGEQIQIGEEVLQVEIADTPRQRSRGLMGRGELAENAGMLFIYEEPGVLVFWMKNTLIPLSIGFFDEEQRLINILDMNPPEKNRPLKRYSSEGPAQYALEVNQGWFTEHGIVPGAKFSFLDILK